VIVNGDRADTGRSVFSSSTITTLNGATAVVDLGKLGKISLTPNSTASLSFDEKGISGDLSAGKLTVLAASSAVSVKTLNGTAVLLKSGESASATGDDKDDPAAHAGGMAWWGFALIFGGAVAGIIWAATRADNRVALGGNGTVVSPIQ
jgi:hypothetical protein